MKKLILGVYLLSFSAAALAQQGQTGANGFEFLAPMQITAGTDNGFLVDRTNPNERLFVLSLPPSVQPAAPDIKPKLLTDQVFTITLPKIGFQNDSKRHEFFATWVPEFELFHHNTDQNAMGQQATATFNYFLAKNVEFSIGDTYRSTHDPSRMLNNVYLLLPRSNYRENDVRANFEVQPNPLTSFGVRYDNAYTNFGQTDPFQIRILDSTTSGYSFLATRMLSRTQRLRGTYSVFKIHPINHHAKYEDNVSRPYAFEHPMHSGSLEYRWSINPTTILTLSGGVISLDTGLNYTFRVNADKRITPYFWVGGGYSRSFSLQAGSTTAFGQGLASNGFFDVYDIRFRGQPTNKTAVLFESTVSRDVAGRLADSAKAFMARTRFDYRVGEREVLFTSFETFHQNDNAYVRAPLSRNRLVFGIEISLSSETDRRLNHSNEDAQYVALTDHQRRRSKPE